jgi:hypothetical protein
MINLLTSNIDQILTELKGNSITIQNDVHQPLANFELPTHRWRHLQQHDTDHKIRWFLLESSGLKTKIIQLYREIVNYNDEIRTIASLDNYITREHLRQLNDKRKELMPSILDVYDKLDNYYRKITQIA